MQTSTNKSSEKTPATGPDAPPDGPVGSSEDSQKWFARHQRLSDKQSSSWDSVQRSFRFSPRPYRWREIILGVGVLYGTFIGLPALGGVWAAWRLWSELHR
jgi:hypothetical protein